MLSATFCTGLCFLLWFVAAIDPYNVLGISHDADEKTIKRAYRQLSKRYHPDKNPSPEAHDKFIEIGEAYEILNDPQKKQNFDTTGDPNGGGHGGGHHMNDFFNQFFGHGGFPGQGQPQKPRGQDVRVNLDVTLEDFYLGKDLRFSLELNNICLGCEGLGSADSETHKCKHCGGSGHTVVTRNFGPMVQRFQAVCEVCQGKGSVIKNPCKTCHGSGQERVIRNYNVFMPAGSPRGFRHVLEKEGDQHPDYIPGNLVLVFAEKSAENWGYRRISDNLYRTEILLAKEAQNGGWRREIDFFDDETVVLERAEGVSVRDGHVDTFKGMGMPSPNDDGQFGNLYVEYRVLNVGKVDKEKDEL